MKHVALVLLLFTCAAMSQPTPLSESALRGINFDQKLNSQLSLVLPFQDEAGKAVRLGDYFGRKPVILVPGYYGCPMLCTLVLNGLIETLQDLKGSVGGQFEVINFSIDPDEKAELAAAKKSIYLRRYGRPGAAEGWHFLTGDAVAIQKLADQIGFHYAYDPAIKQYAHPSGFVVVTPQGKVVRYFFGVDFSAKDLDRALAAASSNRTESPVRQFLLLCFHYSPITSKYGGFIFLCVRVCGLVTLLGLGLAIVKAMRTRKAD
jgi:protein SCO1